MQLLKLENPRSAEQAGRLEPQGRADVVAQIQRLWGDKFLLPPEDLSFFFANWMDEARLHYGE